MTEGNLCINRKKNGGGEREGGKEWEEYHLTSSP